MDISAENYRRFLDGDQDGLAELIKDHRDGLMLFIQGFTGDILLAEEITEDTFVKLVVKKPRFRGKSSFKTFLFTLAKNAAADYFRRNRRYAVPLDECRGLCQAEEIETAYLKESRKIAVHRALEKLGKDYRQVLYLAFFEDFSNEEIAKIMHKNKRQVENLLYRAKQSLKNELLKEGFEYENL